MNEANHVSVSIGAAACGTTRSESGGLSLRRRLDRVCGGPPRQPDSAADRSPPERHWLCLLPELDSQSRRPTHHIHASRASAKSSRRIPTISSCRSRSPRQTRQSGMATPGISRFGKTFARTRRAVVSFSREPKARLTTTRRFRESDSRRRGPSRSDRRLRACAAGS